jgi:hypothetical protein
MYYGQYQMELTQNQQHVGELNSALQSYRTLAGGYNTGLKDLNTSLTLLAGVVASMNTSTPAYAEAIGQISVLWNSYQNLARLNGTKIATYEVNMLIVYGNSTEKWYNDSSVRPGWNAYLATLVLLNGRVQSTWYPQYGEHFVEGINGVPSSASTSWFVWDYQKGAWKVSPTGSDGLQVYNDTVFAWTLCGYDANFNPGCTP